MPLGYVVNVTDAINLDICVPGEYKAKYLDVLTRDSSKPGQILKEKAYRCRVEGVKRTVRDEEIESDAKMSIQKMLFLSNGWVSIRVRYIDGFGRLIVEIEDPVTGESFKNKLANQHSEIYVKYAK